MRGSGKESESRIVSEPCIDVQRLGCRLPSLPSLHFIALPALKGQTITTNDPLSRLFEIGDYPEPSRGIVFHPLGSREPILVTRRSHLSHTRFDKSA